MNSQPMAHPPCKHSQSPKIRTKTNLWIILFAWVQEILSKEHNLIPAKESRRGVAQIQRGRTTNERRSHDETGTPYARLLLHVTSLGMNIGTVDATLEGDEKEAVLGMDYR